jgi:hypothetical protein
MNERKNMKKQRFFWEQDGFTWNREELTRLFLPENTDTRAFWSDQTAAETASALLGMKKL